jgi:hypothetical protein
VLGWMSLTLCLICFHSCSGTSSKNPRDSYLARSHDDGEDDIDNGKNESDDDDHEVETPTDLMHSFPAESCWVMNPPRRKTKKYRNRDVNVDVDDRQ